MAKCCVANIFGVVCLSDQVNLLKLGFGKDIYTIKSSAGYEGMHGWHGWGTRNIEGDILLEFAVSCNLVIGNTCFKSDPITWSPSLQKKGWTQIDNVHLCKTFHKHVTNVKVIPVEKIAKQHHLLVFYFHTDKQLLTVQSKKSKDAGKSGRMVAASMNIGRSCASPDMLSTWANSQAKQKVLNDPSFGSSDLFRTPTKWDTETWSTIHAEHV